MAQMRIKRAATMPGSPLKHTLYIIEDDTNVEFHYVDAAGTVTKQSPAAAIAALGSTSNMTALSPTAANISAVSGTYGNATEPTGAEVDTSINVLTTAVNTKLDLKADNADVETLRTEAEARIDAVEAKVDAVIAAMKTAKLMKTA